jgi:hypothetical protein
MRATRKRANTAPKTVGRETPLWVDTESSDEETGSDTEPDVVRGRTLKPVTTGRAPSVSPSPEPDPAPPRPTPSARTLSPVRTKQEQLETTAPLTRQDRIARDFQAAMPRLVDVYETFYSATGSRKFAGRDLRKQLENLYFLLSEGSGATYTAAPIDLVAVAEFFHSLNRIASPVDQPSLLDYQDKLDDWFTTYKEWEETPEAERAAPPTLPTYPTPEMALTAIAKAGEYIHVKNTTAGGSGLVAQDDALTDRARRVVVNVRTQQAALKAAQELKNLFTDPAITPYFRSFKLHLSTKPEDKVKLDKMVAYYRVPDPPEGAEGEVEDVIGGAIADAVGNTVTPNDLVDEFAPFYARVDKGMAWGEESKYHGLSGTFTEARDKIIAGIITKYSRIADAQTFLDLLAEEFTNNLIDKDAPHRHLPQEDASESSSVYSYSDTGSEYDESEDETDVDDGTTSDEEGQLFQNEEIWTPDFESEESWGLGVRGPKIEGQGTQEQEVAAQEPDGRESVSEETTSRPKDLTSYLPDDDSDGEYPDLI